MEFLFGIAVGIAIVFLGIWVTILRFRRRLEAMLEQANDEVNQITARVEEHDGVFYLYNTVTNEFLVQGSSASELVDRLGKPNLNIVVNQGDAKVLGKLRDVIQQRVQDA